MIVRCVENCRWFVAICSVTNQNLRAQPEPCAPPFKIQKPAAATCALQTVALCRLTTKTSTCSEVHFQSYQCVSPRSARPSPHAHPSVTQTQPVHVYTQAITTTKHTASSSALADSLLAWPACHSCNALGRACGRCCCFGAVALVAAASSSIGGRACPSLLWRLSQGAVVGRWPLLHRLLHRLLLADLLLADLLLRGCCWHWLNDTRIAHLRHRGLSCLQVARYGVHSPATCTSSISVSTVQCVTHKHNKHRPSTPTHSADLCSCMSSCCICGGMGATASSGVVRVPPKPPAWGCRVVA